MRRFAWGKIPGKIIKNEEGFGALLKEKSCVGG
jgi:hypothetical protein